jgi:nucleotide-binding universal stress UspA family protein
MKKIVVAVDFSSGSLHALEYAIVIANQAKSDILMIWVDKTASSESIYSTMVENYRGEVVKRFNDLIDEYQPKLIHGKMDYKMRKGKIYSEIVTFAKIKKADMIIAGSHGVSGFEEFWIGSNANRIVAHARCPVVTVRNGYDIKDKIAKIVVPIDHSNHTLKKIPFTAHITRMFGSEVHILVLFSTNLQTMHKRVENFAEKAKKYFDKANVSYQVETIQTQNATKATIEYAQKIGAELISIMTEQDERKDSGLLGPCAQQVVNHSPIPVLSIHTDDENPAAKEIDQI